MITNGSTSNKRGNTLAFQKTTTYYMQQQQIASVLIYDNFALFSILAGA